MAWVLPATRSTWTAPWTTTPLDNPISNGVLTLSSSTGPLYLEGGFIDQGTINTDQMGDDLIAISNDTNYLDDVTLNGNLDMNQSYLELYGTTLTLDGGTLGGAGTIDGSVDNVGAIVTPGDQPGTLSVTGNYTQDSGGSLDITIGGDTPAGPFSQLAIAGTATLAGTLNVALVSPFSPVPGDDYPILTFSSETGAFATDNLPNISPDVFTPPVYEPASIQIVDLGPGVTVFGTNLYLVGGISSNDRIEIQPLGRSDTGSTGVLVAATLNRPSTWTIFSQAFSAIYVYGFAGNDTIRLAAALTISANISAGNGNDDVAVGNGTNVVTLGDGNDDVTGGDGNNTVTLGNGNDSVRLGNGNNVVVEGNGNDEVTVGNGDNLIVAGLGHHVVRAGNGSNILIDGSVQLTQSGDSLQQVLDDWVEYGDLAADVASIRSRLAVTYNTSYANTLDAGSGLDWFWYT